MGRGRPRKFDPDEAIQAALFVFWEKGFENVQIGDLTAAMGVNPPSFYAAFQSKEALFREVVPRYIQYTGTRVLPALEASKTAALAMRALLEASADIAFEAPGAPGCMTIFGIVNSKDANSGLEGLLRQHRFNTHERIRERLVRGIAEGDLPADTDVERLARFFAGMLQAISLQARDGATRAEVQAMIDTAMGVFKG